MKAKQTALTVLTVGLILLSSLVAKVYFNARSELNLAEDHLSQNRFQQASTHFQRSLHWFFPGLDFKEDAAKGLWRIAEQYENAGDLQNAVDTYRLLRGSFYGARSFYTPGRHWIDRCNLKIAELMARQPPPSATDAQKSFAERKREYLSLLTAEKSPHANWALTAELGFSGWVACCVLFIFRGLSKSGELQSRPALIWGTGFLIFYGLWILGMSNT